MANAGFLVGGLALLAATTHTAEAENRVADNTEISRKAVLAPPHAVGDIPPATGTRAIDQTAASDQNLPMTDAELADYRGGQNIVVGNQTLNSTTSGNTINGNYLAGSINISNSAFSNFNGVGNFAINTGAQVSLQSALNLTINVSP